MGALGILQKPMIREGKKLLVENRKEMEEMFKEAFSKHELKEGECRFVAMLFSIPDGSVNYSIVSLDKDMKIVRVAETKPLYELAIDIIDSVLK